MILLFEMCRSIAGRVFRALRERRWTFDRTLIGEPGSGHVHGQAQFDLSTANELLYREQGQLTLASMKTSDTPMDVSQRYFYVYDETDETLKVYFVEKSDERGSFFHQVQFDASSSDSEECRAAGEHQCQSDHYSASYLFQWKEENLSRFEIIYTVRGPCKDYISRTIFQ